MTASYFVIKNLIQNQLMWGQGHLFLRYTSTEHKIRSYLYLSQCAGSLLQIFLTAFQHFILQSSFRNWRNNSITGACQILPRASFNFVSHLKQIVVQMGLTITVSTVSLQRTLHCLQPIMSVLKRITICLLCFHFALATLIFMKIFQDHKKPSDLNSREVFANVIK